MPDVNRRTFLGLIASAAVARSALYAVETPAAESPEKWFSRTIALRPEDRKEKPPVVSAIRTQPQGEQLATAGDDHLGWVWNFETGEPIHRLDAHTDWVRTIDYSPNGRILATAGNDRQIIFWDAHGGDQMQVFARQKEAITAIAFSHQGDSLAAAGFDDRLRVYEVRSGKLVQELTCSCPDMRALAWSGSDTRLAAGGRDGKIRIWNAADGKLIHEHHGHRQRIRSLVFSPEGERLASSGEDRVIRVSRVDVPDEGLVLPDRSAKVLAIAFVAPHLLATGGSDNLVRIWDLASRTQVVQLAGHTGSVAALVAREGALISGSYDTTVRIWSSERAVKVGRGKGLPGSLRE